jgi:hypothetical protein
VLVAPRTGASSYLLEGVYVVVVEGEGVVCLAAELQVQAL